MTKKDRENFIKGLYDNEMTFITWGEFRHFNKFGLSAEIYDKEEETLYSITTRRLENVIDKVCHDATFVLDNEDTEINILRANKYLDTNYLEQEDIDTIFQLALFGEIRY
jgi:hypothetical protein